jgi:hypothetical protein
MFRRRIQIIFPSVEVSYHLRLHRRVRIIRPLRHHLVNKGVGVRRRAIHGRPHCPPPQNRVRNHVRPADITDRHAPSVAESIKRHERAIANRLVRVSHTSDQHRNALRRIRPKIRHIPYRHDRVIPPRRFQMRVPCDPNQRLNGSASCIRQRVGSECSHITLGRSLQYRSEIRNRPARTFTKNHKSAESIPTRLTRIINIQTPKHERAARGSSMSRIETDHRDFPTRRTPVIQGPQQKWNRVRPDRIDCLIALLGPFGLKAEPLTQLLPLVLWLFRTGPKHERQNHSRDDRTTAQQQSPFLARGFGCVPVFHSAASNRNSKIENPSRSGSLFPGDTATTTIATTITAADAAHHLRPELLMAICHPIGEHLRCYDSKCCRRSAANPGIRIIQALHQVRDGWSCIPPKRRKRPSCRVANIMVAITQAPNQGRSGMVRFRIEPCQCVCSIEHYAAVAILKHSKKARGRHRRYLPPFLRICSNISERVKSSRICSVFNQLDQCGHRRRTNLAQSVTRPLGTGRIFGQPAKLGNGWFGFAPQNPEAPQRFTPHITRPAGVPPKPNPPRQPQRQSVKRRNSLPSPSGQLCGSLIISPFQKPRQPVRPNCLHSNDCGRVFLVIPIPIQGQPLTQFLPPIPRLVPIRPRPHHYGNNRNHDHPSGND